MSGLEDSSMDKNIQLVESINSRVASIHKQLCEYEESIDPRTLEDYGDANTKIMDLLETLDVIQEATQYIQPHNLDLRCMQRSLEEQIKCLDQSVELLKLERKESDKSDEMDD